MIEVSERICSKTELKAILSYELQKYGQCRFIEKIFLITETSILRRHQILLRKTEYYTNSKKRILEYIYKIRLYRLQNLYGLHIPLNCCKKGLKIMHVGSVLINPNAKIGEDCSIHINVGIVANGHGGMAPIIGNGVTIGVGATVMGDIVLADNIAVGANSVVNKSFNEENVAVAGAPAKVISKNGTTTWYA